MMSNIFFRSWYKYLSCLRHLTHTICVYHRVKIRCYKIVRAYGSGLYKIFQPFFTTKPTGQGTGLGLSLSYDIIKAHGGEIKVNTKENEGSEFVIVLPLS
jgi:light-regulated signal transduction histidine kinase (bacteriophytochrome)